MGATGHWSDSAVIGDWNGGLNWVLSTHLLLRLRQDQAVDELVKLLNLADL
jgi:hypothetical protein